MISNYESAVAPTDETCAHSWVAGMMHVHDEDLDTVASMRRVECERCEAVYVSGGASSCGMDAREREALAALVTYCWDDEFADYEEQAVADRSGHVYEHLVSLARYLERTRR